MNDKIKPARLWVATRKFPYLSDGLWAMTLIRKEDMPVTMGISARWVLYYHPRFVEDVSCENHGIEKLGTVLSHEYWHPGRKHHKRAEAIHAEPETWNTCADAEINDNLEQADCLFPNKYPPTTPSKLGLPDNKFAEEYYYDLKKRIQEHPSMPQPGGNAGNQVEQIGGSGSDGVKRPWEDSIAEDSGIGLSEAEAELVIRQVAKNIIEASKSRGSVPLGMKMWADTIIQPPKVDWRQELLRAVKYATAHKMGMGSYTYQRPNRRQDSYGDIIMPGLRQPMPNVAVIVDSSGSMHDLGTAAMSEVHGLVKHMPITLLSCDSEVHNTQRIFSGTEAQIYGGGGTSMTRGIEVALKVKPKPDIVVVITDGETPWPADPPPRAKLIVVLVKNNEGPKYGKTIHAYE